jgi:hypothetical protein
VSKGVQSDGKVYIHATQSVTSSIRDGFRLPHCGAYAGESWLNLFAKGLKHKIPDTLSANRSLTFEHLSALEQLKFHGLKNDEEYNGKRTEILGEP